MCPSSSTTDLLSFLVGHSSARYATDFKFQLFCWYVWIYPNRTSQFSIFCLQYYIKEHFSFYFFLIFSIQLFLTSVRIYQKTICLHYMSTNISCRSAKHPSRILSRTLLSRICNYIQMLTILLLRSNISKWNKSIFHFLISFLH